MRFVYGPGGKFLPDGKAHIRIESGRLLPILWRTFKGVRARRRRQRAASAVRRFGL